MRRVLTISRAVGIGLAIAMASTTGQAADEETGLSGARIAGFPSPYHPSCPCPHRQHDPGYYQLLPDGSRLLRPTPLEGFDGGAKAPAKKEPGEKKANGEKKKAEDGAPPRESPQPDFPGLSADQAPARAPSASLASASGAASAPASVAPGSIGDFLGGQGTLLFSDSLGSDGTIIPLAAPGRGRRFRIVDNQSPVPQDRFYFNYHHFEDGLNLQQFSTGPAATSNRSFDVNRYVFGLEKTFWCSMASIQLQVPFSSALASDITAVDPDFGSPVGDRATELDNIALALKLLLYQNRCFALSTGLGVDLPTAEDVSVEFTADDSILIENETVTLSPYVGLLYTPNPTLFLQGYVQFSLPAGENSLTFTDDTGVETTGEIGELAFMYLDISAGFWLYRDPCSLYLKGIAPMVELHYTTAVEDGETIVLPSDGDIISTNGDVDFLNLTLGGVFLVGDTSIRPAVVIPLLEGEDEPFDWELTLQVNRFF